MEQRDYLKDQIDQLARVLGAILDKMTNAFKASDYAAVEKLAETGLKKELSVDLDELRKENVVDFNKHIHQSVLNDQGIYKPMASIFELIGDSEKEKGNPEKAKNCYHKAIELLEFANQEGNSFSLELNAHIQNLILKHKAID